MDNRLIFRYFFVFVLSWGRTVNERLRVHVIGLLSEVARKGWQIRLFVLTRNANKSLRKGTMERYNHPRKVSQLENRELVPKPTLVDGSRRPRRLEDRCLRNLAN